MKKAQQAAMDAMRAKSATKEGQARSAAADAEKAAMLAKSVTKEGQARSAAADAEKAAMLAKKTGSSAPKPFKPNLTDPVRPRSPMAAMPQTKMLQTKMPQANTVSNAPMEQVEIDKANKMAAMPQTKMPQANTVPNAQMAAMQKMPQPGTVPPANAMPMAPSPAGGAFAMKRGGSVRSKPAAKFSSGGSTSKTSSRGDGIAQRGKTKGRYI
jgi:hypothetical protein